MWEIVGFFVTPVATLFVGYAVARFQQARGAVQWKVERVTDDQIVVRRVAPNTAFAVAAAQEPVIGVPQPEGPGTTIDYFPDFPLGKERTMTQVRDGAVVNIWWVDKRRWKATVRIRKGVDTYEVKRSDRLPDALRPA